MSIFSFVRLSATPRHAATGTSRRQTASSIWIRCRRSNCHDCNRRLANTLTLSGYRGFTSMITLGAHVR